MLLNVVEQQITTLNILFQIKLYFQEELVKSNLSFVFNYILKVLETPVNCKLTLK